MADKKIIAIMGATGSQGGGLAQAILNDPNGGFAVRAITRDVNSDKAKALKAKGAEVVAADIDDVESLKKAFAGAYGVYGVTFFWAHFSPEKENQGAKNIAAAGQVVGESLRNAIAGVVVGFALALVAGRLLQNLLVGVSARDPLTLGAVITTLIAVAALAALLPAWRAARVDPATALRGD